MPMGGETDWGGCGNVKQQERGVESGFGVDKYGVWGPDDGSGGI